MGKKLLLMPQVSQRVDRGVLYGGIILIAMYLCISFEIANRSF